MERRCQPFATVRLDWLLLVAILLAVFHVAKAQESEQPVAPNAKSLIDEAFAKARSANSAEDYSKILELLEQAMQVDPNPEQSDYVQKLAGWTHNRRGELYANSAMEHADERQFDAAANLDRMALAEFEMALQKNPNHWKAYHNRGVSYAIAQKYAEALSDFNRVIDLRPDYAKAWFNRAEAKYSLGDFTGAVKDYDQAIQMDPSDYIAYLGRGHSRFQLKRFRQALADYDRAVSLRPDSAETLANRADAYQSLGMWQRAADDYRRAIQLDDRLGRVYQSAAWLMSTCPDARFRDAERALAAARKAIELDGEEDFLSLDTLAAAHANAEQFDEALQTLARAIEKAPQDERESLEIRRTLYEQRTAYRQGTLRDQTSPP